MIVEDGLIEVATVGVDFRTVRGSHALLTRVLFPSPLYVALNEKEPADEGVIELEEGTKFPAPTATVDVEPGVPVHTPLLKNA